MVRRFRLLVLAVVIAALAAATLAPVAANAAPRGAHVYSGFSFECMVLVPRHYGGPRIVQLVKEESAVTTPDNASSELQQRVSYVHGKECGAELDAYAHARLNTYQDAWYDALHAYLGLSD